MTDQINGRCLCGDVQFTLTGPFKRFYMCHCDRCRKKTGTAHASNIFTSPDAITWISGEEKRTRFKLPEAKSFTSCFCTKCGSATPYVNEPGTALVIPAGSLDDDPGIRPFNNIFWSEHAPWYEEGLAAERCEEYPG